MMSILLRRAIDLVCEVLTAPIWIPVALARMLAPGVHVRLFQAGSQTVALLPGDAGNLLRRAYYRMTLDFCSRRCTIAFGTILSNPHSRIGDGTYIGAYCLIGLATIEADCLIGSSVSLLSGKRTHNFERTDVPMRMQGGTPERITISADTWIGNGAIIMTDIAHGVVVGAGAVVTRPPVQSTIVAGNPARQIGLRSSSDASLPPDPALPG
jgi:virginiamycin A acetyltransferase